MKYDPDGMPGAGSDLAHPMTHVFAVITSTAFFRSELGGDDGNVSLVWPDYHGFGLRPGYLFGEYQFTTFIVVSGFVQKENGL